jgi:hypothetical protein
VEMEGGQGPYHPGALSTRTWVAWRSLRLLAFIHVISPKTGTVQDLKNVESVPMNMVRYDILHYVLSHMLGKGTVPYGLRYVKVFNGTE